mmetsp:Transcript_55287/g.108170  ORF Transcript_55287/g.108170 Transcript_55287/m.108170 type:complete len:107 (+) Transcript_55287:392-712(+)
MGMSEKYRRQHETARQIRKIGAVSSEYPPGCTAKAEKRVQRAAERDAKRRKRRREKRRPCLSTTKYKRAAPGSSDATIKKIVIRGATPEAARKEGRKRVKPQYATD